MVALEQHFEFKNLASEKLLMEDGRYAADLTVEQITDFLIAEMQAS